MQVFDSEYIKLNKKDDWKAHVLYGLLDIRRPEFESWADKIFPDRGGIDYSSFDLLIMMLVKQYIYKYGANKKILWNIEWNKVMKFFIETDWKNLRNYIFNINLEEKNYQIYESLDQFNQYDRRNLFIHLELFIDEIFLAFEINGLNRN